MANSFDNRLVTLEVVIQGQTYTFDQNYYIFATGTKYTNGNFGEAAIRIDNISKQIRDFIALKTSRWTPQRSISTINLYVGRASYGTFQIFTGAGLRCNPSQPPDIGMTLISQANIANMGNITSFSSPTNSSLKSICQQVASNNGLTLQFQAKSNPSINNYHFTGAVANQIKSLNSLANINAYQDGQELIVTDAQTARSVAPVEINKHTGMVGIPEVTETGVRVRMLILNELKVGAQIIIDSDVNPAANGAYIIFKLSFEVASRDTPFYWVIDGKVPLGSQ